MSSTSKARLQAIFDHMDLLFSRAHPADVEEIVKELRSDISRRASAARAPGYDKHSNVATGSGFIITDPLFSFFIMVGTLIGILAAVWTVDQILALLR